MTAASVVLFPSPGMGHLVSMFELAKLLSTHKLAVTILTVEPHYNAGSSTAPFIARAAASNPSISFRTLPSLTPPPNPSPHHEALALDLLRLSNPNLLRFLSSSSPRPDALIIDFFCGYALDVTPQLRIPTYVFFTSPANYLSVYLHSPQLHAQTPLSFRELGPTKLEVPGVPPLPADHMPLPLLDRDDDAYRGFLYLAGKFPEATGIIVNTVYEIERRAVDAITAAGSYPPVHCIGPLINSGNDGGEKSSGRAYCLDWLDRQPRGSVVFLSFGSLGLFSARQLREIARGLELSGQRFLWVVRAPPSEDNRLYETLPEPNLEEIFPDGFLGRTEGRGLVVKSWAPQAAILRHEAVGGFVTHCGWNSILEAICGGVPMIGWPLYAEQRVNVVFMVEELELAVEMKGYDGELVGWEEVEGKVRWLMESEGGRALRERTERAKEAAEAAVRSGGSSHSGLMRVLNELNLKRDMNE